VNLGALAALVLLSPLIPPITAAVKLISSGPVFERSTCSGFEGLPFPRPAFRCVEAGPAPERPGEGFQTSPIWLGRWLRRAHPHKSPDPFNVLQGEMSRVGPRPH
jgi:putative colanic acid biosynthesis UDP-glucose lipid carrier transferase